MNFLNVDNPFWRGVTKVIELILLDCLWLLCSIPIFTIGASTTALYYAIQKNIKHDLGNTSQQFFRGFRENFKQSTIIWLILFALCMLFSFDLAYFRDFGADGHPKIGMLQYIFYGTLFVEIVYFLYLFPYIARFQNTLKNVFMNATLLIVRHPLRLLACLLFLGTCCFLVWLLPITILIAPAVCIWQISIMMEKTYQQYMSEEDKELERHRYGTGED